MRISRRGSERDHGPTVVADDLEARPHIRWVDAMGGVEIVSSFNSVPRTDWVHHDYTVTLKLEEIGEMLRVLSEVEDDEHTDQIRRALSPFAADFLRIVTRRAGTR